MKVIIAGTRTFQNYEQLQKECDAILCAWAADDVTVISGAADGADRLGERYAKERGYEIIAMPADWRKHGRGAGPIRNRQMARLADAAIVFWDGVSRGSKNMIDTMQGIDKRVWVVPTAPAPTPQRPQMPKSILIRVTAHDDEYDDISAELMFVDYQSTPQGFDVELGAQAEAERLREAVTFNADQVTQAAHDNAMLRAENERLREALRYYAKREDWESWNGSDYCQFLNAACDGWETAERALATIKTGAQE